MTDKISLKRDIYLTRELVLARFNHLKSIKPLFKLLRGDMLRNAKIHNIPDLQPHELVYYPDRTVVVVITFRFHYELNDISDHFIEDLRLKAMRYDAHESPWDYMHKEANIRAIRERCISQFGEVTPFLMREIFFESVKEVASFRPLDIMAFISRFGSKRVLDPCSGWGDRMIGSLASGVELYCGVDPNPDLHPRYAEMQKLLPSVTHVIMIESPFETATLPVNESGNPQTFDLIFTSPPYFDLEVYTDKPGQSLEYGGLDEWYNKFLLVSLKKAWSVLESGGRMCININDIMPVDQQTAARTGRKVSPGAAYCQRMVRDVNDFPDSVYEGPIMIAAWNFPDRLESLQPIWTWRKEPINPNPGITIQEYPGFTLIQDAVLPGGTKQRAIEFFRSLRASNQVTELVYAGPNNGMAQVAIGVIGKLLGYKRTMFTTEKSHGVLSAVSYRGCMYGTEYHIMQASLELLQEAAEAYCREKSGRILLKFGLDATNESGKKLENVLADQIIGVINPEFRKTDRPIWLVAGSAVLLHTLYSVFPNAKFHAVQVGNMIQVGNTTWSDTVNSRTTLHVATEQFYDDAVEQPPYETVSNYDAKLWKFVSASTDACINTKPIIWNVGGIPEIRHAVLPISDNKTYVDYLRWESVMYIHKSVYGLFGSQINILVTELSFAIQQWLYTLKVDESGDIFFRSMFDKQKVQIAWPKYVDRLLANRMNAEVARSILDYLSKKHRARDILQMKFRNMQSGFQLIGNREFLNFWSAIPINSESELQFALNIATFSAFNQFTRADFGIEDPESLGYTELRLNPLSDYQSEIAKSDNFYCITGIPVPRDLLRDKKCIYVQLYCSAPTSGVQSQWSITNPRACIFRFN